MLKVISEKRLKELLAAEQQLLDTKALLEQAQALLKQGKAEEELRAAQAVASGFTPKDTPTFGRMVEAGEVEYSFTSGGVDFFRMVNEQRIPAVRAMKALDRYAELEWKIDREHIANFCAGMKAAINAGDLQQCGVLVHLLSLRAQHVTNLELLFNLGAVLYFTRDENPEDFDEVFAEKKKAIWRKERDVEGFFLRTPFMEYLPFSDFSEVNFRSILEVARNSEIMELTALLSVLSEHDKESALQGKLSSRLSTLRTL